MQLIDSFGKYYYCPVKKNRLVDDDDQAEKQQALLKWAVRAKKPGIVYVATRKKAEEVADSYLAPVRRNP